MDFFKTIYSRINASSWTYDNDEEMVINKKKDEKKIIKDDIIIIRTIEFNNDIGQWIIDDEMFFDECPNNYIFSELEYNSNIEFTENGEIIIN